MNQKIKGEQVGRQAGEHAGRHEGRKAGWWAGRQASSQAGRQASRQAGKQAEIIEEIELGHETENKWVTEKAEEVELFRKLKVL